MKEQRVAREARDEPIGDVASVGECSVASVRRHIQAQLVAGACVLLVLCVLSAFVYFRKPGPDQLRRQPASNEPLFVGLGNHRREIGTASSLAQKYFDQGLAFLYGFNHAEASRSFEAAARYDPNCPMAFWGIAMASGPDVNNMVIDDDRATIAWTAATRALALSRSAAPVERALIEAAGKRYAYPPPQDRKPLDQAYAAAMWVVWKAYPHDADVGALTAEALLDLRPWGQWTRDGKPQPGTEEIIRTLDSVLAESPMHPFALHLFIHAVEESTHPERADGAADLLRKLAPGIEHLLHMPSHIDIRRGRWEAAVITNVNAIAADRLYQNVVSVGEDHDCWVAHDYHMLAYAAAMQGQSEIALRTIKEMTSPLSETFIKEQAKSVDILFAMPYELRLRFGHWDEMLAEPQPKDCLPIATALWRYGRGIAFAATCKGRATGVPCHSTDDFGEDKAGPP
jgi:hypothetical protein